MESFFIQLSDDVYISIKNKMTLMTGFVVQGYICCTTVYYYSIILLMHLLYIIIKIFIISTLFNSLYRVGRKPNPHELMIIHMLKCVDSDPQAVLYVRIFFCPLVTLKKNVVAIEIAAFWCVSAGWNLLVVCWETVHVTGFCYLQLALFHCMVRYGSARLGTVRYGSVRVGLHFHCSLVLGMGILSKCNIR